MKEFVVARTALRRRHGLVGVGRWRQEKQRKKNREKRRQHKLNRAPRKQGDDTQQHAHASAKPEKATGVTGSQKVAGGEVSPTVLFTKITELPLA